MIHVVALLEMICYGMIRWMLGWGDMYARCMLESMMWCYAMIRCMLGFVWQAR